MNPRHSLQPGFTLVELIVALAILGVIIQLLLSMQSSTMEASTQIAGQSDRLRSLQDASTYIGGQMRSALAFRSGADLMVDGESCQLSPTTSPSATTPLPCFALMVGRTTNATRKNFSYDASGNGIAVDAPQTMADKYLYLVYRVVPRNTISSDPAASTGLTSDGGKNAWADDPANKVYALVEQTMEIPATSTNCSTTLTGTPAVTPPCLPPDADTTTDPIDIPSTLTTTGKKVVIDYLNLTNNVLAIKDDSTLESPVAPDNNATNLKLYLQITQQQGDRQVYTPSTPLLLTISRRG